MIKKLRIKLINHKIKKVQYDLAWVELQLEFGRIGNGCYIYLKNKYDKKLNKLYNKKVAL